MKVHTLCFVAAAATSVIGFDRIATAQEGIAVTPVKITENRNKNLDPTIKKKTYSYNSLGLTLRLSGKSLVKMTRIGRMKIKAVDDKGNTLKNRSNYSLKNNTLQRVRRPGPDFKGNIPPRDRHEFFVSFYPPARGATAIAELTGSITVRIAETVDVFVPIQNLKGKSKGDVIEEEALKKQGVIVELRSFSSGTRVAVEFKITGEKRDSLVSCILVDSDGKNLGGYGSTYALSTYLTATASTSKAPPKGAKVKLTFEQKYEDVDVSLNRKSISLP